MDDLIDLLVTLFAIVLTGGAIFIAIFVLSSEILRKKRAYSSYKPSRKGKPGNGKSAARSKIDYARR